VSWLSRIWKVLVSWLSWVRKVLRSGFGPDTSRLDHNSVDDVGPPSSLSLLPGPLKLRVGVVSTVGNVREHNEDNFYVPGRRSIVEGGNSEATCEVVASTHEFSSSPLPLFIVADGMGGQQAGEEASRMAIEIIPRSIARRLPAEEFDVKTIQAAIRDAVAEANQEILGSSGTVTEYSNMGTTVVLSLFRHDRAYVAGIGDSRAYRLRHGEFEQLTKDHSLADALVEAGTITKEELPNHKFKNILYLYLGSKDARGGPEDVRVLDVQPDDRFLLASDGLTGVVRDDQIAKLLAGGDDPQRSAKQLTDLALSNDSKDNVTCLVIHVTGPPPQGENGPG
jgi:serine/threonine protein phosphatase PrpC